MLSLLSTVALGLCVADLVMRRGSQALAWLKGEVKDVEKKL